MPWPRGSLLTALLILSASLASADTITVNTTTDDNAANSLCSLREAVEYFNLRKSKAAYQGCVGVAGQTNIITLGSDAKNPYVVASPIYIHTTVTINGVAATGDTRTIIKASGLNRLFVFYDKPVFKAAACGLALPTTCEVSAGPHLASGSDTGDSITDFLTEDHTPSFTNQPASPLDVASFPQTPNAVSYSPGGSSPPGPGIDYDKTTIRHYIRVTLYEAAVSAVGDVAAVPAKLLGTQDVLWSSDEDFPVLVPPRTTKPWAIDTSLLSDGDHHIDYTTQDVTTITVEKYIAGVLQPNPGVSPGPVAAESAHSPATAIRVYPSFIINVLTLNLLDLEGCAPLASDDAKDCSASADVVKPDITDAATGLVYSYTVSGTAGKGGIIFGTSVVALTGVTLHGGHASAFGGAVYISDKGSLGVVNSEVRDNKADHGAAFYVANTALELKRTLVTANKVIAAAASNAAVVEVAALDGGRTAVETSTISGNQGVALSLQGAASSVVSSSTIALNEGGINFNSKKVPVYNSIVAGNPDNFSNASAELNCTNLPLTPDFQFSVSISGGGCILAAPDTTKLNLLSNKSSGPVAEKLMAELDSAGNCRGYSGLPATFKGMGILCPLADNSGTTRTHLIRLLPSYTSVSDSPLMTKGPGAGTVCDSTDQRAKDRHSNPSCDIGALELQPMTAAATSGGSISYGQAYTSDVYGTGDEELFDPLFDVNKPCPSQTQFADKDKLGCPWLETAPTRGTVVFNANGTYTYTPTGNFHGFDRFTIRVVTTLSRLNTASGIQGQSRLITAQVIVEPTSGMSSSSLGVFDWELIILGGLLSLVRRRYKQGSK